MKENENHGLDPRLKVCYLLNGIRRDKLSIAVAALKAFPDKYEKDVDSVVALLTQHIDKQESIPSIKVVPIAQTRLAYWQKTSTSHGTFKGKIKLKKYSREGYDSMLMAQ